MQIDRDVAIAMSDGIVLRADLFRPDGNEPAPVIANMGPYGKGLHYSDAHFAHHWERMIGQHPEVLKGRSSGQYMNWETVDPEVWTEAGYAVMRVDSRGAGRSPGVLDVWSPQEAHDLYEVIEWAGSQPWCTGKVGLAGTSYYAMNQWWAAALQPPHLAGMVAWEGANDFYREVSRQGGIFGDARWTSAGWYEMQVLQMQHGRAGLVDHWTGESATGPEILSEDELAANRVDMLEAIRSHPFDDEFHRARSADFSKIETPFVSAAEWAHFDLHGRGNFEAFTEAASKQKWLEVHSGHTQEIFFLPYGVGLQMRFFDHFLKGLDNGFESEPRVLLNIRHTDGPPVLRTENEWPLARTRWTDVHLDAARALLGAVPSVATSSIAFEANGDPVSFFSEPLEHETEITGPVSVCLNISSSTTDADLFLTLRVFDPNGDEFEFQRGPKNYTPLSRGWLRASHRKLDPARSKPWRPFHAHDSAELLEPDSIYRLDVEIWPTCLVLPAGFRICLTVGGRDFERENSAAVVPVGRRGSAKRHSDAVDRPESIFGGSTTIHTGGGLESYLRLPVIPAT